MDRSLPENELDVRGLKCPLPAMLARKALARLAPLATLTVLADDPMALVDMPYMCHREGHTLEHTGEGPAHAVFHIRAKTGVPIPAAAEAEQDARGDPLHPEGPHRDQGV